MVGGNIKLEKGKRSMLNSQLGIITVVFFRRLGSRDFTNSLINIYLSFPKNKNKTNNKHAYRITKLMYILAIFS